MSNSFEHIFRFDVIFLRIHTCMFWNDVDVVFPPTIFIGLFSSFFLIFFLEYRFLSPAMILVPPNQQNILVLFDVTNTVTGCDKSKKKSIGAIEE